jgi:hypothetical protein
VAQVHKYVADELKQQCPAEEYFSRWVLSLTVAKEWLTGMPYDHVSTFLRNS